METSRFPENISLSRLLAEVEAEAEALNLVNSSADVLIEGSESSHFSPLHFSQRAQVRPLDNVTVQQNLHQLQQELVTEKAEHRRTRELMNEVGHDGGYMLTTTEIRVFDKHD